MKSKKTRLVWSIILSVLCLLVVGCSYLPVILKGDAGEYFSSSSMKEVAAALEFQNEVAGTVIAAIFYVMVVFVIVMFIVTLFKRRGVYALFDLLALILLISATSHLIYCFCVNTDINFLIAFASVMFLLCIFAAIFPLIFAPRKDEKDDHEGTALAPLPSTIPTVEKKASSEDHNGESVTPTEDKAEEVEDMPAEEPTHETKEEDAVKEEPTLTPVSEPEEVKEEPVPTPKEESPALEEKEEEPAPETKEENKEKTDSSNKTKSKEEKPMKAEKKPAAKATPAPKAAQKAQGKYEVYPEAGFFKYRLKANNGEILIVSNGYKTRDGAHKGIDTLIKAVGTGVAKIVIDKNKYAQFRLYTAQDSRLIVAGEYYPNAKGAQSALDSVEKFYKTDKIVDLDEIPESEIREWRIALPKAEPSDKGKFEIYIDEAKKFRGRLLANNGQLLFATSAYAAKSGVTGALEKVQKKFASKDVTVTCDKQGRYQFIIYADNGAVLVMGESYTSKDRAISAAKSSMNFSAKPQVIDVTKEEE